MHSTELHHSSPEDAIEVAVTFWRELISDFNLEISRNAIVKHTHDTIANRIMITDIHNTILLPHIFVSTHHQKPCQESSPFVSLHL